LRARQSERDGDREIERECKAGECVPATLLGENHDGEVTVAEHQSEPEPRRPGRSALARERETVSRCNPGVQ
jgi:hypothetical protein